MTSLAWWGLFFGLCLLLELSSPGYFFFLSFSIGALAAAGVAWYDLALALQGGVFIGVSTLAFLLLRRYVARIEQKNAVKTNVYALQGKKGVVIDEISPLTRGWIKVEGELWAAMPCDESIIEKGAIVKVTGSAGSHLTVKKLDINS